MTELLLLAGFIVIPIVGADLLIRTLACHHPHWLHTETEHTMTTEPRPDACCGVCPGIVGGGYDCTCENNPRCDKDQR